MRAANPFFGGVPSAGLNPAQLGFDYWWDASQGVTGTPVTAWVDRIGSKTLTGNVAPSFNAADSAFGGAPSVSFDGAATGFDSADTAAFWDFLHRSDRASTRFLILRFANTTTGVLATTFTVVGNHGTNIQAAASGATTLVTNGVTSSIASETAAAFGTTGSYFCLSTHGGTVTVEKGTRGAGSNSVANAVTSTSSPHRSLRLGFTTGAVQFAVAHVAFKKSVLSAGDQASLKAWAQARGLLT